MQGIFFSTVMTFQPEEEEDDDDNDDDDEYSPFTNQTKTRESFSFSKSFFKMAFN